jgi:opacity protein-like surface antigen
MKYLFIFLFSLISLTHSNAQTFIGLSGHNNQYSFLSSQLPEIAYIDYKAVNNNVFNATVLFRQQIFKYLDICMEVGYEKAKLEYQMNIKNDPYGNVTTYISEPHHLIAPVYLQPKFRFRNIAAHLNAGIAPQYIQSHKIRIIGSSDKTTIVTDLDNRYNYSFILGGGLDYYIKERWLISVNYFTRNIQKEWNSFGGHITDGHPMLYNNNRISLSLAYNLGKKQ